MKDQEAREQDWQDNMEKRVFLYVLRYDTPRTCGRAHRERIIPTHGQIKPKLSRTKAHSFVTQYAT